MSDKRKIFWAGHIEEWNNSGLSQAEYCRQKNLNPNIFSKWKIKSVGKEDCVDLESANNFIEVQIPEKNQESEIELVIKDIFKIKLKRDFDRAALKDVLQIIGEIQCY
jgi:hypothetical protein